MGSKTYSSIVSGRSIAGNQYGWHENSGSPTSASSDIDASPTSETLLVELTAASRQWKGSTLAEAGESVDGNWPAPYSHQSNPCKDNSIYCQHSVSAGLQEWSGRFPSDLTKRSIVEDSFGISYDSHNSINSPFQNNTIPSPDMAMLFPWTYYFANRRIPSSSPEIYSSPNGIDDDILADEDIIWPYHSLTNTSFDQFGSGDGMENMTTYMPPFNTAESNGWELNYGIHGVLMPLIAIFGVAANFASFVVLTRHAMRSAVINTYLAALSAFDGLLLLIALLLYPPMAYCEWYGSDAASPWCRYFFHSALITYPLSLIAQSGSVWTLTAITVDRFIAITWPLESRKWCTNRRALIVSIAILVWSILYNIPAFFELKLVDHPIEFDEDGEPAVFLPVLDKTDMRKSTSYVRAYKGYCYLIFMLLLPAGTMIALNTYVTVSVRKASRMRRRSMNVSNSGREDKERRCTLMAILVVGTFLLLNSLAFVNNMLEGFWSEDELSKSNFLTFVCIGNVLVALNSATNFFIYYALGLRFRQMLCKLFCCWCYTPEREYQYLSVYYGSGRNFCWTNGAGGREANGANDQGSTALLGGGIISMKTLPPSRQSQRILDRPGMRQTANAGISPPLTTGHRQAAVNVNRRSPSVQSTGAHISPPMGAANWRSYQQQGRPVRAELGQGDHL